MINNKTTNPFSPFDPKLSEKANDPSRIDYCPPDRLPRSRIQITDPDVTFLHIRKIALGGAKADIQLPFLKPCNWIMVVSVDAAHTSDTLFLHFRPLGFSYTGNAITPIGSEEWLPLFSQTPGKTKVGCGYRFTKPMPMVSFLDIGQEAGGTDYNITFAAGNDVDFWNIV